MAAKRDSTAASSADREILITRLIDAPREMVYDAWTDPEHLPEWWGPNGFKTTTEEITVKPGHVWLHTMRGHGMSFANRIVYLEVDAPERLVYRHGEKEGDPNEFEVTVTFEDQGGSTLLTMRSVFPSAVVREQVVKDHKAIEGGNQTLDRLEAHLRKSGSKVSPKMS